MQYAKFIRTPGIAAHILASEGESHVERFEGNFQDYEKGKMCRLGQGQHHPASGEVQEADEVSRLHN
jgi:hypothetical protein